MKIAPFFVIAMMVFACNLSYRMNIEKIIADAERIRDAEAKYYADRQRYGSLQDLSGAGLVEKEIVDGKDAGFFIELEPSDQRYALSIYPDFSQGVIKSEDNEQLSIYCDQTGILRANLKPNQRADAHSDVIHPGD